MEEHLLKSAQQDLEIARGDPIDNSDSNLSKENVELYCDLFWPFLQIVNGSSDREDEEGSAKFEIITDFGWIIHDHEASIILSPIHDHEAEGFSMRAKEKEAQYKVIAKVVKMVVDRGWPSVVLFDGTTTMKTLLHIESEKYGLELKGYTPQPEEEYYKIIAAQTTEAGMSFGAKK